MSCSLEKVICSHTNAYLFPLTVCISPTSKFTATAIERAVYVLLADREACRSQKQQPSITPRWYARMPEDSSKEAADRDVPGLIGQPCSYPADRHSSSTVCGQGSLRDVVSLPSFSAIKIHRVPSPVSLEVLATSFRASPSHWMSFAVRLKECSRRTWRSRREAWRSTGSLVRQCRVGSSRPELPIHGP